MTSEQINCAVLAKTNESDENVKITVSESLVNLLRNGGQLLLNRMANMGAEIDVTLNNQQLSASITFPLLPILREHDKDYMLELARKETISATAVDTAGCGIINHENNCYVSSVLQAIFHIQSMGRACRSHLLSGCCSLLSQQVCLVCRVARTWLVSKEVSRPISVRDLFYEMKKENPACCLRFRRQEDAHELLVSLFDAMENSYRKRKDAESVPKMPLIDLFAGQLVMNIQCKLCGYVSERTEDFRNLLMHIVGNNSIEDAIGKFFEIETIDEPVYNCDGCKQKVPFTKRYLMKKAPKILCVQLHRFDYIAGKIHNNVTFDYKLSLEKYKSLSAPNQDQVFDYNLISVVKHLGRGLTFGHYFTCTRVGSNQLYRFNDSAVSEIDVDTFTKDGKDGYLYFYELNEDGDLMENALSLLPKSTVRNSFSRMTYKFLPIMLNSRIRTSSSSSSSSGSDSCMTMVARDKSSRMGVRNQVPLLISYRKTMKPEKSRRRPRITEKF